jgi:hypothetical protein
MSKASRRHAVQVELPEEEAVIDSLYDQLRDLVVRSAEKPELRREIDPLVRKLRMLQAQEADAMESRYRERLLLQPGEGRQALEAGRRLLRK